MRPNQSRERGQALVLVTLSLAMIMGVLALATDLGWSHFIKKSAQTAADAGAMAAGIEALAKAGNAKAECGAGGNVACQPSAELCDSATPSNLHTGCLYAERNGFRAGGKEGRQSVSIAANAGTLPLTANGVKDVFYWVTVTAQEKVPLMFSALMARGGQMVSARATAVITNGIQGGTLYLLNRQNDSSPVGTGMNLDLGGNTTITAPGGIFISSNKNPSAKLQGTPYVRAPMTYIRGGGKVAIGGSARWEAAPSNGFADDAWYFKDPMGGKGQPPAFPTGGLTNHVGVLNGDLSTLAQPLRSGQYYAKDSTGKATGARLTVGSGVTFQDGAFGSYVLYGGLNINSEAKFYPGRYVLAGVKSNNPILAISNTGRMYDNSTAGKQNDDAGEIFVLTDAAYPGLEGNRPAAVESIKSSLVFGSAALQSGNSQIINLHGLNRDKVPTELKDFAPVALWQDQRNSRVKYDKDGNIDISCGGASMDNPCTNPSMSGSDTPRLKLQAHPNTNIYGAVYQPRGAWIDLQGNGSINSPLMIITGAMVMDGGCDVGLLEARDQLRRKVVALVE